MYWLISLAIASPLCSETPRLAMHFDGHTLTMEGVRDEVATIEGYVRLGKLYLRWTADSVLLSDGESSTVTLDIPPEAFLHEKALDYVSNLSLTIRTDTTSQRIGPLYLVWTDGGDSYQVFYPHEAPPWIANGVLRSELREGLRPGVRLMPPELSSGGQALEARSHVRPAGHHEAAAVEAVVPPDQDDFDEDTGVLQ